MGITKKKRFLLDLLTFLLTLGLAILFSLLLSRVDNDNNPFAMPVFILAVAVVARLTDGYFWGIAASIVGTVCVNYMFTRPFWEFNVTYPGYPLTFASMLIVSFLISALTTQIKHQEQLRFEMERERIHADLLRAIAHDIRTPLAAIVGASSAIEEQTLPPEEQRELAAGIRRDANWLVRITENLLTVTRVTGTETQLRKEDEVLEEIIGSAILKYHRTAGALPVTADTLPDILTVPIDGTLIEQVLINLFDNVSAHAEGATQIWLHIEKAEDFVTLSVEDDGKGLSPLMQTALSEGSLLPPGSLSDRKRDMGIGLSVCRSIVRAHGGELTMGSSRRHGGARASFTLPRKDAMHDDKYSASKDPGRGRRPGNQQLFKNGPEVGGL